MLKRSSCQQVMSMDDARIAKEASLKSPSRHSLVGCQPSCHRVFFVHPRDTHSACGESRRAVGCARNDHTEQRFVDLAEGLQRLMLRSWRVFRVVFDNLGGSQLLQLITADLVNIVFNPVKRTGLNIRADNPKPRSNLTCHEEHVLPASLSCRGIFHLGCQ